MRAEEKGKGTWERKWECERDWERGVSFSSVWPLSHSNSGLATWTAVPLSSPAAQNLTPSVPDYSSTEHKTTKIHKGSEHTVSSPTVVSSVDFFHVHWLHTNHCSTIWWNKEECNVQYNTAVSVTFAQLKANSPVMQHSHFTHETIIFVQLSSF